MSIPKIAISNDDDSGLRILQSHLRKTANSHPSSPHKSIIKTRSSQPQSPTSSTTTQSFHTCRESIWRDSSSTPSALKRSRTISVAKDNSEQRKIRRINSYQSSSKRRSVARPEIDRKRRATLENFPVELDNFSVYGTPRHDEASIRLIMDTDTNLSTFMNNRSDMQVDLMKKESRVQPGVRLRPMKDDRSSNSL